MTDPRDGSRDTGADERLRAVLRGADPATSLPPLDPHRVERRTEEIMQDGSVTERPRTRRRAAIVAGVVAAAAVVVAVVVTLLPTPAADPTASGPAAPPPIQLTRAPSGTVAASCAVLTPDYLRQQPIAFAATVARIDEDLVVLDVTRTYRGALTPQVVVPQQPPGPGDEFSAARFEQGRTYLVSADEDRTLTICGATGPDTPDLRALYDAAFGR